MLVEGSASFGRLSATRAHLLIALLIAAAATARVLLATQVATPWLFVDELIHSELAKNLAAGHGFSVRGHAVTVSYVYPALIAPAWLGRSLPATYALAKAIGAVVMTLGALPVYFWGRRFLSARGAVAAAALTLCLPAFVLTGTLMTETVFFPAFLLACFATGLALERPTLRHQALVAAAVSLACATRVQGLVLVPIVCSAVAADAALRRDRRALTVWWPFAALLAGVACAYVLAKVAAGQHVLALGVYEGVRHSHYSAGGQVRWLLYSLGELVLSVGVVPACALAACLPRARETRPAERAFLLVAASAVACVVVLGGVSASWMPVGLKERYMFYAAPLLLLALVLWAERAAARGWGLAAAAAALALALVLPLDRLFGEPALLGNELALVPFSHRPHARLLVACGSAAAAAGFAFLPRRFAPGLLASVAMFLLLSSASLASTYRAEARAARLPERTWIDDTIGRDAHAVFLNTAEFEPETLAGRSYRQFVPVWESEFWNRSLRGVVSLGLQEPAPLPQRATTLDWASGRIVGLRSPYVVARSRFELVGKSLARSGDLELWRSAGEVRLTAAREGIFADGTANPLAAYSRWTGDRGRVTVVATAGATVEIGPLAPSPGGGAHILRVQARIAASPGEAIGIESPRPPFRVEVHSSGGRVSFRFRPR